jgi:hypothetical protein
MNKLMMVMCLALFLGWTPAFAVKVTTLYEVQMSVASQAADARAEAIREGFQDVLIKLSGDQNIASNKLIKDSLNKSDYYVQEYSYSSPTVNSATYTLNIKYNEPDVKRLLRKAGVVGWGSARPLIIVWLATVNDKREVDILGVETPTDTLEKFKRQGQRYGLPLIFPVMDVTDMNKVTSDNITSVALSELKDASKRYEPDAILVGTIEYDNNEYQGRWNLVWKDKAWDWSITGATQEKVIADVLHNVSRLMSQSQRSKMIMSRPPESESSHHNMING